MKDLLYILLALGLVLALPATLDLLRAARLCITRQYFDLRIWHEAASDFLPDPSQPLYQEHRRYLYPPFFLTLLWPLTRMPETAALIVFQTAKWLATGVSFWLAWRLCSRPGEDVPPIVLIGTIVCSARFFENEISNAQVNSLVLLSILTGT